MKVKLVKKILEANDRIAASNRELLSRHSVLAINLMSAPGAGKTTLLVKTIKALDGRIRIGVIEGDIQGTHDAEVISKLHVPVAQINTDGACHLDANMISDMLQEMPLDDLDLLVIENVGNLVCPTGFRLGVHRNALIASVPEGDDKPYKYPGMYLGVDTLLLNKVDVLHAFDFDMDYFQRGVEALNPGLTFYPLSCKTGEGLEGWLEWLRAEVGAFRAAGGGGYDIR
jgi:hydrogenase nickel incorporation protein HypB